MQKNDENLETNQCEICQKIARHKCGGCHKVYYCDKQHQRQHWKDHKRVCRPFKVEQDTRLGRFLVATRPIRVGDVVIQEAPIVWGPAHNSAPICLGCGKDIDQTNSRPCFKCGWPVCSDLCEKSPSHIPECRYTTQRGERVTIKTFGIQHPIYRCITVLRCLYLKQFLPKRFRKLNSLESHDDARKLSSTYESDRVMIAEFIRRFFKLSAQFSESDVMQICGIVSVNGHEVPLSDPPHVAVYATSSMLEHNCKANCAKSFTSDGQIVVTAAQPIASGDHLSICYADSLWGTPNRRCFLKETKFFECQCERCRDPSEFNTDFSGLKCQDLNCCGVLLPESFVEESNKLKDWSCKKCKRTVSSYNIHDILERVGKDLFELDKNDVKSCKTFLKSYDNYLSPNHFYLVDVKCSLAQILGQHEGLSNLSSEDLGLKLKLCQDLVGLLKILAPAEKRTVGVILFELHAALAEITRRKSADVCPEEMRYGLMESRRVLVEAVEVLKHEPEVLPEGKICTQAKKNLKDLDVVLKTLQSNMRIAM